MSDSELFDPSSLLVQVDAFMKTMYTVQEDFSLEPKKNHIATCINYSDLIEMRDEFVKELKNTITAFVYSEERQEELVELFKKEGRSRSAAWSCLNERARSKFRPSFLQGQFSELLLSNLLQHYFRATPLLRKMPITTNPSLERNGADAIHIKKNGSEYILYIGEAKTYDRSGESLKAALVDSIKDVIKHYKVHRNEINLYTYEDFLPPELEKIARDYMSGIIDVEVHLICIVTYDNKTACEGKSRKEILASTIEAVRKETIAASTHPLFRQISQSIIPRLNYIIFPVQEMKKLIVQFEESMKNGI